MNEFWAALAGAIVGSLASGAISYVLQRSAFNEQKCDREEQQKGERRALGHSLFFKMLSIWNSLSHIKSHVEDCQKTAAVQGDENAPPVTFLLPILNIGDPVQLDAAEMSMLLAIGEDEVFNRALDIPQIYNSILPVWQHYAAMRNDWNATATTTIDISTGIGTTKFAPNSPAAVAFFETNKIAQQLIERATRDEKDASETAQMMVRALNEKVGAGIEIEPKKLPEKTP